MPAAFAGDRVDLEKAVPGDAYVRIENTRGEVNIMGWEEKMVRVTGELDDLAEELIFDVDGRDVTIEVKMPRRDVNWGDGSDLRINVPVGSRVKFEGVSSDVSLSTVSAGAQVSTVSGDIEITEVRDQLRVKAVSGDIDVTKSSGVIKVSTISGEIEVQAEAHDLSVDTVSGDIEVELGTFDSLYGRAVSGDVGVEGKLAPNGRIDLSSVSGEVDLELEKPINAELFIRSGIGGDIRNDLTDDEPKDMFPSQQSLRATAGDGSGRISIETVSADIRLH
jgi:DUF4097 and DUF4098 domain-containing protein YvlB